jgi:threonine synthase
MIYQSTRSQQLRATSTAAVLRGIAPDGGLYMPDGFGAFDWQTCLTRDPFGMATQILSALLPEFPDMAELVKLGYTGKFESNELTPLVGVGKQYVLELFHGPTSAFKDVALSMLPRLITAAREVEGQTKETLILTATSGDTGKAALEGFHDVPGTKIIVFYPDGGVSAVQKAQMVTQEGNNVCVCAVRGNFDDAQTGVKEIFASCAKQDALKDTNVTLSSANSINIGRLAPQVTYYFKAYADLVRAGRISVGDRVHFVVPTGNFGDILAGYFAKCLGLPVGTLVCASNANNVLTDFLRTGVYDRNRPFYKTLSPSMDILVSSNLERLLYLLSGRNCDYVRELMDQLRETGRYQVEKDMLRQLQREFACASCSDGETRASIARVWEEDHYLCDTHTAVAMAAARQFDGGKAPVVVLSTASPYKFPAAVLSALGQDVPQDEFDAMERLHEETDVPIPQNLAALRGKTPRHADVIDRDEMLSYILKKARKNVW